MKHGEKARYVSLGTARMQQVMHVLSSRKPSLKEKLEEFFVVQLWVFGRPRFFFSLEVSKMETCLACSVFA